MTFDHIPLSSLKPSTLNVRKKGGKAVADLVPSIRSLGLIQPLIVRPNCEGYDIIAGQRRFHALSKIAEEDGDMGPVPCVVMAEGDDAKAIEASLAENLARLPMDEIDQYKAFAALAAKGMEAADIACRFGVTERLVRQRLAIAGLIPQILTLYRKDEIGAETLRVLTLATKRQQKDWLTLHQSEDDYAPLGRNLRDWLFGGAQVPVAHALFDVEAYGAPIIADLFGENRYFSDAGMFWEMQNRAIAERAESYREEGWADVVIMEAGQYWPSWEYRNVPKSKGGKVYVTATRDGEVTFHEGYLTNKEAARLDRQAEQGQGSDAAVSGRAEITAKMRRYLGLHRHAAVRTELLSHPGIAIRLIAAHLLAGSSLWRVEPEIAMADGEAADRSVQSCKANTVLAEERVEIMNLLGLDPEAEENAGPVSSLGCGFAACLSLADWLDRLIGLEDDAVQRVLTYLMAETLEARAETIDALGERLGTDMRSWWSADDAFFELMRDKAAINAMVREVSGDIAADTHVTATARAQQQIIRDSLSGERTCVTESWIPGYMEFPIRYYLGDPA